MDFFHRMISSLVFGVLMTAGCSTSHGDPAPPGADAGAATSLEGEFACGTMTCGTGQLCFHPASGNDAGPLPPPSCVTVPDDCGELRDCGGFGDPDCCGEAHRCARTLCGSGTADCAPEASYGGGVWIDGRNVGCVVM